MSIVPVRSAILPYYWPSYPVAYTMPHPPAIHSHAQCYPAVYQAPDYLAATNQLGPCVWFEEDPTYRIVDAKHNPGSFWIWSYDQ